MDELEIKKGKNTDRNNSEAQKRAHEKYRQTEKYWKLPSSLFSRAKASAKSRKIEFSLSKKEYIDLIESKCYFCNDELENGKGRGIGLNRIESDKGFIIGNVLRACGFCSIIRSEGLTVEEMKKVSELLIYLRK